MKKVSLHFGINKFSPEYYGSGNDLRGCENDIIFMEKLAREKSFETNVFLSQQATYQVYVDFLTRLSQELESGDTFFFNISCHGTFEDYEGGGKEKRRTALCLYDRIVWDYETKEMLKNFKEGVNIVWVSDCCHARDNFKSVDLDGISDDAKVRSLDFSDILKVAGFKKELELPTNLIEESDLACNIIAYSSSTEFQVSYDLKSFVDKRPMGLFTASLEKVLSNESNKALNYYQIYKRIHEQVSKSGYPQTPNFQVVNGHKEKNTYKEFLL